MTNSQTQPIGIFDSGIGGLSVAQAVVSHLPNENIIYFGDTAHMPYGEKSTAALQSYAVKIAYMLLEQKCKVILIACNSASAAAYDLVKEYVGGKALVINVIDPLINHIKQNYAGKKLGLIGTKQTVNSQIYPKKIQALNLGIELQQRATPILAALIEEQFSNPQILDSILGEYLTHSALQEIDGLILGCTHYPVVKKQIEGFYKQAVNIIDSSDIVAQFVKHSLTEYRMLNEQNTPGTKHFYLSDYTESFEKTAKLFFKESIHLERYPLWD